MKTYYYYYRDETNVPLVTVCLMATKNYTARGISTCSPLDIPCKETGRRLARGKALRALGTKMNSSKVGARERVVEVLYKANVPLGFLYKSEISPELTDFERNILKRAL